MPQRRYIQPVRIAGIDHDLADLPGRFEPDVCPRLAGIRRFEHADSIRVLAADVRLTGSDINNIRVRRRHRDRADRANRNAFIRDREPSVSRVLRFPHTAADGAHIERIRLIRMACDAIGSTATQRSHVAPCQARQHTRRKLARRICHHGQQLQRLEA